MNDRVTATLTWQEIDGKYWKVLHNDALGSPAGAEVGIVRLMVAIWEIALHYQARYGSSIGDDGVLGPAFVTIVRGFRTMLNSECGRLDRGTLDAWAVRLLKECGEEG